MKTAEILSLISTLSFVIAGISLVVAVFLWFFFKIPSVIGDLSGRTAKKSIARKRASNERAGGKGYKPSATNVERGKLTDTMQHSNKLTGDVKKKPAEEPQKKNAAVEPKKKSPVEDVMPETGLLATNKADVVDTQQTELLDSGATDVLLEGDATTLLWDTPVKRVGGKKLTMLDEVMLIHTDEVI